MSKSNHHWAILYAKWLAHVFKALLLLMLWEAFHRQSQFNKISQLIKNLQLKKIMNLMK